MSTFIYLLSLLLPQHLRLHHQGEQVFTKRMSDLSSYLHLVAQTVSFSKDLSQSLHTNHVPEGCLSQQFGRCLCVCDVGDRNCSTIYPEVDYCIHGYSDAVSCQYLANGQDDLKFRVNITVAMTITTFIFHFVPQFTG